MRNRISIYEPQAIDKETFIPLKKSLRSTAGLPDRSASLKILNSEGRDGFANYIEWLGLDRDPNIVVLSSMHHYFYDAEEMRHVKTVINLKELNLIKHLEDFIHTIHHILAPKSYFLGYFTDNKKINGYKLTGGMDSNNPGISAEAVENGIVSRNPFLNMIYSIIDSRTNSFLSRRNVASLFENRGFRVVDFTQLNDRTYFCAQKIVPRSN